MLSSILACSSHIGSKILPATKVEIPKDTSLISPKALVTNGLNTNIHPLSEDIKTFINSQETSLNSFKSTGLTKNDYLSIIEGQVRAMVKYQNDEGRIIDPVENIEKYYTTPCFAHAVSVLVASSTIKNDSPLALSGMKALDVSLSDMAHAKVNGNHGDFYTWPVMLAYKLFKDFAKEDMLNSWNKKLKAIDISKLYAFYNQERNLNWILVHASGEFLRAKEGFTSFDYAERMIKYQMGNFTNLGMYNEHGNPFAYDIFARHYLNGMLQLEYRGEHYLTLRDQLWKGAWTSLFLQSPFGELPTGFRSSHHIWNEAEQCVVFEIYAAAYAKLGLKKEAGAFKRAAMLSLNSIGDWIRKDGSGYVVKNRFPIEKKHAYEPYSVHTCYNMLAMSMLAQAWEFSDNAIKELPAPADVGGFVVPVVKPFHKVFANLNGNYIQYDTDGDQKYNPTGILRVHLKGGHPQLGPSDGVAELYGGKGNVMALGPSWKNADGTWASLATYKNTSPKVKILERSSSKVRFSITHNLDTQIKITETISITDENITITNEFEGISGNKRLVWPMLVHDGANKVTVVKNENTVSLMLNGKGVKWSVNASKNVTLKQSDEQFNHRNGIVSPLYAEYKGDKITYTLESIK